MSHASTGGTAAPASRTQVKGVEIPMLGELDSVADRQKYLTGLSTTAVSLAQQSKTSAIQLRDTLKQFIKEKSPSDTKERDTYLPNPPSRIQQQNQRRRMVVCGPTSKKSAQLSQQSKKEKKQVSKRIIDPTRLLSQLDEIACWLLPLGFGDLA